MTGYSHGMNTDTVRELAAQIDSSARDLRSIDNAIERVMADLGRQWQGGDYVRFKGWWQAQHRPHLQRMVGSVEGLARSARYNADDQDRASRTVGGSAPGNQQGPSRPAPIPAMLDAFGHFTGIADSALLLAGIGGVPLSRHLVDPASRSALRLAGAKAQRGFLGLFQRPVSRSLNTRIGGLTSAANSGLKFKKNLPGTGFSAGVGAFLVFANSREYGSKDARTVGAGVDGVISTAASFVPGGSLVYGGTRYLSGLVNAQAEKRWSHSERVVDDYAQRAYGVSSIERLTPTQLAEVCKRYEGVPGLWNSTSDQAIAAARGIGNVARRGLRNVFGR